MPTIGRALLLRAPLVGRSLRAAACRQMSGSGESFVDVSTHGACMALTLARPKALNSLTLPMVRDLYAAYEKGAADPAVKCILLEGSGGKAFCAGGDVRAVCEAAKQPPPSTSADELPITDAFFREEYALNAAIGGGPVQVTAPPGYLSPHMGDNF